MKMKKVRSSHTGGSIKFRFRYATAGCEPITATPYAAYTAHFVFVRATTPRSRRHFTQKALLCTSPLSYHIQRRNASIISNSMKNHDSKRDFPHQSGMSSPNRTVFRVSISNKISISPLFRSSCIIYSRHAPQGEPTLPSSVTATTLSI